MRVGTDGGVGFAGQADLVAALIKIRDAVDPRAGALGLDVDVDEAGEDIFSAQLKNVSGAAPPLESHTMATVALNCNVETDIDGRHERLRSV